MSAERKALEAAARLHKNLEDYDSDVAYELSTGGERADLWTEIDVSVEDLRSVLEALSALDHIPDAGNMVASPPASVTGDAIHDPEHGGTWSDGGKVFEADPVPATVDGAGEALRAEVERLRNALKFYASPSSWTSGRWVRGSEEDDEADEPVANLICVDHQIEDGGVFIPFADTGDRARAALRSTGPSEPATRQSGVTEAEK